MKFYGATFVMFASLYASPAVTAEIKRFDVEAHCKRIAGFGGTFSEQMFSFCFDEEQASYNSLKEQWSVVPENVASHCYKIAQFGGPGSYQMLKFCVDEEMQSLTNNQSKEFKF